MTRAAVLFLALSAAASAQTAHLRVDADAGRVVVDGLEAGAPGDWIGVAPGDLEVALVDDPRAWDPRRATARVSVGPGDSVSVALRLPQRVRVESLPIRALVVRAHPDGRRDTLGRAPLEVDLEDGETVSLVATLDRYRPGRLEVDAGRTVQTVVLLPLPDAPPDVALLPTERSTARRTLVDLGIGAATLAAGALAVHYKFRADSADDRYRAQLSPDRGDESFRQEALRLDRLSAAALVGMQVGVGVLAVRFVLR